MTDLQLTTSANKVRIVRVAELVVFLLRSKRYRSVPMLRRMIFIAREEVFNFSETSDFWSLAVGLEILDQSTEDQSTKTKVLISLRDR
jgi:hypothetical protein